MSRKTRTKRWKFFNLLVRVFLDTASCLLFSFFFLYNVCFWVCICWCLCVSVCQCWCFSECGCLMFEHGHVLMCVCVSVCESVCLYVCGLGSMCGFVYVFLFRFLCVCAFVCVREYSWVQNKRGGRLLIFGESSHPPHLILDPRLLIFRNFFQSFPKMLLSFSI